MQKLFVFLIISFCISCRGTIETTRITHLGKPKFKNAYIISSKNSQFIKFKFGTITSYGYIPPKDGLSDKREVIGNTDIIIKQELEKHGITAVIGQIGDTPEGFDLIVEYNDTWRWDFKIILDNLEIIFISPDGKEVISKSVYKIHKNKEVHNFPTPKRRFQK